MNVSKNLIRISLVMVLAAGLLGAAALTQGPDIITNSKQITFVGPRSGEGYYSADGKKMIFQSERVSGNPFYQMFILDLESGKVDLISTGKGKTTCGWIHPNMEKVMWSSTHLDKSLAQKVKEEYASRANPVKGRYSWSFDEHFDIFESDLKGKNQKRLTKELGYDAEGSYSPDGKYIAFASNRTAYDHKLTPEEEKKFKQDPSYFMEIYIMKADGSDVRRLTNVGGYDGGPFFSADGKKITWRRFSESGSSAEIFTMNVDGSEQKQITNLNAMSWAPYFDPSGDYVIFASTVGGYSNFELFIVDSLGKFQPKRVTFAEGFDGLSSFSPDGTKVTWSHKNEKGESHIYIADWNDARARELLGLPAKVLKPGLASLRPEISEADTKAIVSYLASEELKGRYTGSAEEKIYTQKIAELFKLWGLVPAHGADYIQNFEFISGVEAGKNNKAEFKGRAAIDLNLGKDYQLISYSKTGNFSPQPVVFAGFGIKAPPHSDFAGFDSYKDLDVKGKWVIILDEAPKPAQKEFSKHTYLLSFSRLQHKITVAKNAGAFGVILVEETKDKNLISDLKFAGSLSDSKLPILKITIGAFEKVLKSVSDSSIAKDYAQLKDKYDTYSHVSGFALGSQYFSAQIDLITQKSIGRNVVAKIEPLTSSGRKNKALLIGAHGDHLGLGLANSSLATKDHKDKIHYGADDNASGVAGVLELAQYYSMASERKKLTRPIYFAVWSGEEIGVLGSHHFVNQYKKMSDKFIAGLNMDMIGRLRESLNIQGVGSAEGFRSIAEAAAVKTGVALNLTSDPYLPTDSMSVYMAGVPSISFFTGAHNEYHTPSDKPETLNYKGLKDTIQVVQFFADEISQKPDQFLQYEKVESNSGKRLEGRSFRIFLGTIPDYTQEGVNGVRITGVAKNSPAEKAGLQPGDVITEFDKTKIENIYDYVYTLQSVKPDTKTQIIVTRSGKSETLEITPTLKD